MNDRDGQRVCTLACLLLGLWAGLPARALPTPSARPSQAPPDGNPGALGVGGDLSLARLLHEVEARNPGLKAAEALWQAERQKAAQAGTWPEPRVMVAYFAESVETRVGPQQQTIGLTQQIPWWGTPGLQRAKADATASAKDAQREGVRQMLFRDTKRLFYELHFAEEALRLTQQKLELLDQLEQVSQTRYEVGSMSQRTLLAIQLEAERLKERVQSLVDQRDTGRIRLAAILDLPVIAFDQTVSTDPQVDYSSVHELAAAFAEQDVVSANPELIQLGAQLQGADAAVDLAKKRSFPQLAMGVQYIQTGDAANPQMEDSGKDPWLISLSLSLPLWLGSNRAAREEARLQRQALNQEVLNRENRLLAELQVAHRALVEASRQIDLHRNRLLPLATEALDVALRDFAGGRASYLEVIVAEQDLLGLELGLARALADRGQRLADMEWTLGRALDEAHSPAS